MSCITDIHFDIMILTNGWFTKYFRYSSPHNLDVENLLKNLAKCKSER